MMLRFYDIDVRYANYLRTIDSHIPNFEYDTHSKFVCGVVLNIDGIKYYAPISHNTNSARTSLLIYDNGNPIASIRFSFMFPAFDAVITEKNFASEASVDRNYANLLAKEYAYCNAHKDDIFKKARYVYSIGCNRNHYLSSVCCDFKNLEAAYLSYIGT